MSSPASATLPHDAWHTRPPEAVAERLNVDPRAGLATAEAERRSARHGRNELAEQRPRSPWRMLSEQFSEPMIMVLIVAAVITGFVGELADTVAIVVIVALNGLIGFVQDYRAERAMAALRKLAAATASVRRDGAVVSVPAAGLVPGDIVELAAGNIVPADLRLLEVHHLEVDESALTGESVPVAKSTEAVADTDAAIGDRTCMTYKGTVITRGRGHGLTVAIGGKTELGKIAALLEKEDLHRTPLQKRLAELGRRLALVATVICAIVFAAGLLRGEPLALMFLTALSLAVAAIPEALPAVITIALALGARSMLGKHALVRRLAAVETLGSVTTICSDKTGTLTQNRMHVEALFVAGRSYESEDDSRAPHLSRLYRALALSTDATLCADGNLRGDPTEAALCSAAAGAGFDKGAEEAAAPRIGEIPFDAKRRRMTTLHRTSDGVLAFTKGAPETVLDCCDSALAAHGTQPIRREELAAEAERLASQGMRVLAVAERTWPENPAGAVPESVESSLVLLGLVALMDPPRDEARDAVAMCRAAGITPVMITGDHPATARSIAGRLGILDANAQVITGPELARMTDDELRRTVATTHVFARVAPEEKLRIVEALQRSGECVAMTGDGINDAPALARADIGVAMGLVGTDVAREAADMVLLDDNFATIVAAVREGRRIFDNIRRFVKYGLTTNAGEVWAMFLAPFVGLPIPLLPLHILWVNLVTDGLPGLALAAEPEEHDVMRRPPRPTDESVFARGTWQHILWAGLLMGAVSLLTQAWAYHSGNPHWQTMVFTVLALTQLGHVLAIRSERQSLFRQGIASNPYLLAAVVFTVAMQLAVIYVAPLQAVFKTAPLSAAELAIAFGASAVVFVAVEIEKAMVRRGWLYGTQTR